MRWIRWGDFNFEFLRPLRITNNLIPKYFLAFCILCGYFLATNSQIRELYIVILEERNGLVILASTLYLLIFSAALFYYYSMLIVVSEQVIHSQSHRTIEPSWQKFIRLLGAMIVTLVPGLSVAAGLYNVKNTLSVLHGKVSDTSIRDSGLEEQLVNLDKAINVALPTVIFFSLSFFAILFFISDKKSVRGTTIFFIILLVGGVLFAPLFDLSQSVRLFQRIGAFGSIIAVFLTLFSIAVLLSSFSKWSGIAPLAILGVLFMYFVWNQTRDTIIIKPVANESRLDLLSKKIVVAPSRAEILFKEWLSNRPDRQLFEQKGRAYPVYIIAAQGGGIYATSTALTFLSRLQDRCSGFTRHIFAISGVSGGAVGATLFQAMMQANEDRKKKAVVPENLPPCPLLSSGIKSSDRFQKQATSVILGRHLAPVVGVSPSDIIQKLLRRKMNDSTRVGALIESFYQNIDHTVLAKLELEYKDHWTPKSRSPALILNATRVETGHRVAFSPFPLSDIGDSTLTSFSELRKDPGTEKLLYAAIVSARFPGSMPPFKLKTKTDTIANFVDGGYADNSGASTALSLFRNLKKVAAENHVDLRLILLANHTVPENVDGTIYEDTVAPISALLNVRSLLGQQSVTRAVQGLKRDLNSDDKVKIVWLDHSLISLPLGWRLSKISQETISFMVSTPKNCLPKKDYEAITNISKKIIVNNACTMRSVVESLSFN